MESGFMAKLANAIATFIMPYYGDHAASDKFLDQAIDGICRQTDEKWHLVVVDDCSPSARSQDHLTDLEKSMGDRITVLKNAKNEGPGACRNHAIALAESIGSAMILFNDADDISHPKRLAVSREILADSHDADFVYSTFTVIDENGKTVPTRRLTPSVREILESHADPIEGPNAWIRIGTEAGYTTLTSTVAVRTELAIRQPFCELRGSEDAHTWYRMSAAGRGFRYAPSIPTLYRIPQDVAGHSDRSRLGADYYLRKAKHDSDGFEQAIAIALRRRTISPDQTELAMKAFLRRLAVTMRLEQEDTVADELIARADELCLRDENVGRSGIRQSRLNGA
jgi:glycosyltransferase involved in cell wall biosynthesis